MEQLLTTKLFIPPLRPELVPRPRLIARLNAGLRQNGGFGSKLTLISAPAGFGKTTLVGEWVQAVGGSTPSVAIAWLTLDENDTDLARFLMYLQTAMGRAAKQGSAFGAGVTAMLQSPQPPPVEEMLTALINDLADLADPLIIVLDDYHLIDSASVDAALIFLLDHLPPGAHLVIATRVDPLLPLARLRARGQLNELRAADLRFNVAEAAEFLLQRAGLNLSPEDVAVLEARTEGWIAGLQLAAISLQGHKDMASQISSFSGSHRFIMDYLIEEVLEQQSEQVQTFLLQTAVISRLTGSLCDALTGLEDGQATLEKLSNANLFLLPMDEERRWYRYHHLFADLLRRRLRQSHPEQAADLYHKASMWYEQHGSADEAIDYALRAGDFDRAAVLVENVAEQVWETGAGTKLQRWLEALPLELVRSKPHLGIYHVWYLLAQGNLDDADQVLQAADQALAASSGESIGSASPAQDHPEGLDRLVWRGRLATTKAFMAFYRGDIPGIIQHASKALEDLPQGDINWRSTATHILGDAYDFQGNMTAAYTARLEAVAASKKTGNMIQILIANLKLAIILRHQGRLQRVLEICQQQLQFAKENSMGRSALAGWLLAILGETLAEVDDVDQARHHAEQGVELLERGGDLAMLGWSYLCLMRVRFTTGDLGAAEEIASRLERTARDAYMPPWIMNLNSAWQARIWLAQNQPGAAALWLEGRRLSPDGDPAYQHEMEYIMLARFYITQRRSAEILDLLPRMHRSAEEGGRTTRMIEILMLHALACQAQGDLEQAMIVLERAFRLAEPAGFVRIFIDEGPAMAQLLYEAARRELAPSYTRRLLGAFPFDETEHSRPSGTPAEASDYIEPLSERELEVLQLIATGITNQEVAARLFLSLNTIKVHTRNIYGKLGVNNRTQAVARARALGVLPHN